MFVLLVLLLASTAQDQVYLIAYHVLKVTSSTHSQIHAQPPVLQDTIQTSPIVNATFVTHLVQYVSGLIILPAQVAKHAISCSHLQQHVSFHVLLLLDIGQILQIIFALLVALSAQHA